jgi:hypothetical protein
MSSQSSERRDFHVSTTRDLGFLDRSPGFRPTGVGRIVLDLPGMPAERHQVEEAALNQEFHACGCPQAALGLVLSVSAYGLWVSIFGGFSWWRLLSVAVLGTIVGKLVGRWLAFARLRSRIAYLRIWATPFEPSDTRCG